MTLFLTTEWHLLRFWIEKMASRYGVAVNVLNQQSQTVDKGWSSSMWRLGGEVTHHCNKPVCYMEL